MNYNEIIKIDNITIKYGDVKIVKDTSLGIEKGEFISIIGPNGAGKSTLLKAVMKNVDISSGEIFIKGINNNEITYKERAKIVGFVPQEFNISFNFTVYDIVKMGRNPYINKMGKELDYDNKVVEESLRKTNTWKYKDKSFNNLSGGEKQRVIIARALAQEPEILILDEATSNLDIHHQLDILELIHWLNRENNITVAAVMHDLNMASRFSDRLILMNNGEIEKQGKPDEVLTEKVLTKIYDMEMLVRNNKLLSCTEIVPLRVRKSAEPKNVNVHIICGGGTGEYIIEKLYSERYNISCGIINEGDSDLELCKNLGINYVSEKPFSTFSENTISKNKEYLNKSNIIIITDVPIGHGNLPNIKLVEEYDNKDIIILHAINRDYVNGEAEEIINRLRNKKNVCYCMDLKEMFEKLGNL